MRKRSKQKSDQLQINNHGDAVVAITSITWIETTFPFTTMLSLTASRYHTMDRQPPFQVNENQVHGDQQPVSVLQSSNAQIQLGLVIWIV